MAGPTTAVKTARENKAMDRAEPWFSASCLASAGERDGGDEVGVVVASIVDGLFQSPEGWRYSGLPVPGDDEV